MASPRTKVAFWPTAAGRGQLQVTYHALISLDEWLDATRGQAFLKQAATANSETWLYLKDNEKPKRVTDAQIKSRCDESRGARQGRVQTASDRR